MTRGQLLLRALCGVRLIAGCVVPAVTDRITGARFAGQRQCNPGRRLCGDRRAIGGPGASRPIRLIPAIALLLLASATVWADELKVQVSATILARQTCHVTASQNAASPLVMHCTGSDTRVRYRVVSGAAPVTSMSAPDAVSLGQTRTVKAGRSKVVTIAF